MVSVSVSVTVSYSRLLLSVLIILLAVEYSTANSHGGNIGTKRKYVSIQHEAKFLGGRKMLQGLDEKNAHVDHLNAQNKDEMLKRNVVHEHDSYITKKNDEPKAFIEAADEVAKLMYKDYGHGAKPRRKPPINNHEPND